MSGRHMVWHTAGRGGRFHRKEGAHHIASTKHRNSACCNATLLLRTTVTRVPQLMLCRSCTFTTFLLLQRRRLVAVPHARQKFAGCPYVRHAEPMYSYHRSTESCLPSIARNVPLWTPVEVRPSFERLQLLQLTLKSLLSTSSTLVLPILWSSHLSTTLKSPLRGRVP